MPAKLTISMHSTHTTPLTAMSLLLVVATLAIRQVLAACHASCMTCDLDSSEFSCITCNSSQFKVLNGPPPTNCICNVGYVMNVYSFTCQANICNYRCPNLCQTTAQACTACVPSSNRILQNNTCICPTTHYDPGQLNCLPCHPTCKACNSLSTRCTQCFVEQYRVLNSEKCLCLTGYFENGGDVCSRCSYRCVGCVGEQGLCTGCAGNGTRNSATGCLCIAGYYDDGYSAICPKCDYSCSTCTNSSSCSTCNSTHHRIQSPLTGKCICTTGYYNNQTEKICLSCHQTCLTCFTGASNACLNCSASSIRELEAGTGRCVCKVGYYEDLGSLSCLACHGSCYQCNGGLNTSCVSCNLGQYKVLVGSSCVCMVGYYIGSGNRCYPCDISCATCQDQTSCLTCLNPSQQLNPTTNLCTCQPSQYLSTTPTTACLPCSTTCQTCESPTICTSCNANHNRILFGSSCVCISKYYDDGNASCKTCHYSCAKCDAAGCLDCDRSMNRELGAGVCRCVVGFVDDGVGERCVACDYRCESCSVTPTNCTSCNTNQDYRLISATTCICQPGYFDFNQKTCLKCHSKCLTCTTNPTTCLACSGSALTRSQTVPNCSCVSKFYDNGFSPQCLPCHYSCKSCSSSNGCFNCDAGKYRVFNSLTGFCRCLVRFYDDGAGEICTPCHPTCLTCTGLQSNKCLSCNITAHRVFNFQLKTCDCSSQHRQLSPTLQLCQPCHPTCQTCNGPLPTNCLTCNPTLKLTHAPSTNTCICIQSYYPNPSLTPTTPSVPRCLKCFPTCSSCTTYPTCTSCMAADQQINPLTGVCQCSGGTVWDAGAGVCAGCHYSCGGCSVVNVNCTGCAVGSFRRLVDAGCGCIAGYYDVGVQVCQKCSFRCLTCNSSSVCLTCDSNSLRYLNTTQCQCDKGYYDDNTSSLCAPCHYTCLTCTGPSACSTCVTILNRRLNSSSNLCDCLPKYFENPATKLCQLCLYHCLTCNSYNSCQSCDLGKRRQLNGTTRLCQCINGLIDDGANQECRDCLYDCATCVDLYSCTSCDVNSHRIISTITNRCTCMSGYYQNLAIYERICLQCHYSCMTCTNSTNCLTCNGENLRFLTQSSLCTCKQGYYDDGANQICKPCHYSCRTCSNSSTCSSCQPSSLRTLSSNQCICPTSKYFDDNITSNCQSCHYSCSACTNRSACTSCNAGASFRVLNPTNNLCKCINGYFDDGVSNFVCKACSYSCQTCDNLNTCLTCNLANNFRHMPQMKCKCIDGYYNINQNPICGRCQYSCKTCATRSTCLSCNALKFRQFDPTTNLCKCLPSYFDTNQSNQTCIRCHYTCKTCQSPSLATSPSPTTCTSCQSTHHRQYNSSQNRCICTLGHYDNLIDSMCQPCHYSCYACLDGRSCSICDPARNREMDPVGGFCRCRDGYFDDGFGNSVCVGCEGSCVKCENRDSCTQCNTTRKRVKNNTADYKNAINPYCSCQYKFYSQPSPTLPCLPCHYSCPICSSSTPTSCLYCTPSSNRILNPATRACTCKDTYYDNGIDQLCSPCHARCIRCTNSTWTSCSRCIKPYYLKVEDRTCYDVCPDGTYGKVGVEWNSCERCQVGCGICMDQKVCLICQVGKKLYKEDCLSICPNNTFMTTNGSACIDCPTGCSTCLNSSKCLTCLDHFFMNTILNICFPCNPSCKTCFGQLPTECTQCEPPKALISTTCKQQNCQPDEYIDPRQGCLKCSQKFPQSIFCNFTHPLQCAGIYRVYMGACVPCYRVPGYVLTRYEGCVEFCGDGVALGTQCDDGNNFNGDGCSEYCTIEDGWACEPDIRGASVCYLDRDVRSSNKKSEKMSGENRIILERQFSSSIRVNSKDVVLKIAKEQNRIKNLPPITYKIQQDEKDLKTIKATIDYGSSLKNQRIQLSYNSSRSPQSPTQSPLSRLLQTPTTPYPQISFVLDFNIQTNPPPNYYSDQYRYNMKILKSVLLGSCCLAMGMVFVGLFCVRRVHVHLFTLSSVIVYCYIVFGVMVEPWTDWVRWVLEGFGGFALIGGVKVNPYAQMGHSSFLGYQYSIQKSSGYSLILTVLLWALYAAMLALHTLRPSPTLSRLMMYSRYFLITLNLILSPHLTYSGFNALWNARLGSDQGSALNVCFGIGVLVYQVGFLGGLIVAVGRLGRGRDRVKVRDCVGNEQNPYVYQQLSLDKQYHQNLSSSRQLCLYKYSQNTHRSNQTPERQPKTILDLSQNQSELLGSSNSEQIVRQDYTRGDSSSRTRRSRSQLNTDKLNQEKLPLFRGLGSINLFKQKERQIQRQYLKLSSWLIFDYAEVYSCRDYSTQQKIQNAQNKKESKLTVSKNSQIQPQTNSNTIIIDNQQSNERGLFSKLLQTLKKLPQNPKITRYHIPISLLKQHLTYFIACFLGSNPLPALILLILVNITYIAYLSIIRPFSLRFTTGRLIVTEVVLGGLNCIMGYYCWLVVGDGGADRYDAGVEVVMVVGMVLGVGLAMGMFVVEVGLAWRPVIRKKMERLQISMRMKGAKKMSQTGNLKVYLSKNSPTKSQKPTKNTQPQIDINEFINKKIAQSLQQKAKAKAQAQAQELEKKQEAIKKKYPVPKANKQKIGGKNILEYKQDRKAWK